MQTDKAPLLKEFKYKKQDKTQLFFVKAILGTRKEKQVWTYVWILI